MVEKKEKLRCVTTEPEKTKKTLCMLNVGTSKLDQRTSFRKPFGDHSDIGLRGENSASKIVFVKSSLASNLVNPSTAKKDKSTVGFVATEGESAIQQSVGIDQSARSFVRKRRGKKFIPVCYFCSVKGHIRSRCFTMMKFV